MNSMDELIAKNTTSEDIEIPSLGYVVTSNGGTKDLFADNNTPTEIFDDSVRVFFEEGDLIIVIDGVDLGQEQSLLLFDNRMDNLTVTNVKEYSDLALIPFPVHDQVVYVSYLNAKFCYEDGDWTQCGEQTILNEGLISGFLYVNQLKVG